MAAGQNDKREALFNDQAVGPASHIQVAREGVTRLAGLVVDMDADPLKANRWFPPADNAEDFFKLIGAVFDRHPVLRHAEVRDTGRWLHLIVLFSEPVELRTAQEQRLWTKIHKLLIASVPSDANAQALITLTRPVGSVNSKAVRRHHPMPRVKHGIVE